MNKKNWLIVLIVVLVAMGIYVYNQDNVELNPPHDANLCVDKFVKEFADGNKLGKEGVEKIRGCVKYIRREGNYNFGEQQHSVDLENVAKLLRRNVRFIAMGDSYSIPYYSRVPTAGLVAWPILNIEALSSGAIGNTVVKIYKRGQPADTSVYAGDELGYTVERQENIPDYFTLPVYGLKERYTDNTFSSNSEGEFFRITLNVDDLDTSVHGPFYNSEDHLYFRLTYRATRDLQNLPEELDLRDDGNSLVFDPRNDARKLWHQGEIPDGSSSIATVRQLNAPARDLLTNNDVSNSYEVVLAETYDLTGTNKYFDIATGTYYYGDEDGNPNSGFYFSTVSDNSWSFSGFGANEEGDDTHDKKFSLEQFTYFLDITTLDREQPVLFFWFLASEDRTVNNLKNQMSAMINQVNDATNEIGLESVEHLIVVPPQFSISQGAMENNEEAAFAIASEREDTSALSIYSATDGVFFDGSDSSREWLDAHGYDSFEYGSNSVNLIAETGGDLLDNSNIHPKDALSATFFASVVGNVIRESGCPADLHVDGIIDVQDLMEIISNWGEQGDSDINQDGTTDVLDIMVVIDQWGDCWPVQSPYNKHP